jgi:hypothetical protein
MPPPDPPVAQGNADTALNPKAQRFLDRHVRYPLGRPNFVRQTEQARQEGRVLPTPAQLISRLAAVDAVLKQRRGDIPASRAKALGDEIAGARAALVARQWSTALDVIELAEDMVRQLPPPLRTRTTGQPSTPSQVPTPKAQAGGIGQPTPSTAQAATQAPTAQATAQPANQPATQAQPLGSSSAQTTPAPTPQQAKVSLLRQIVAVDAELAKRGTSLKNLAERSHVGGDLKIIQQRIKQSLERSPLTDADVAKAAELFTELKVKADFVAMRQKQTEARRGKLDEYAQLLAAEHAKQPGPTADALLADKSLKAGDTFKAFCQALKDYEVVAAKPASTPDQLQAGAEALRARIDKYLAHFEKFSSSEKARSDNQRKHAAVLQARAALVRDEMVRGAAALHAKGDWSRQDEAKATELYLQMMLELAELSAAVPKPKNLKEGGDELVMQIKNEKNKSKLVVKPIAKEIAVDGFVSGGGGSREMLANVMADKLQEMLGIELNVPVTKVVAIDGGRIGMPAGTKVTCSAQAWSKDTRSLLELINEHKAKRDPASKDDGFAPLDVDIKPIVAKIPKSEVQNKALFDLIALHCDRHAGNFMVDADMHLVPIDHGNVLPTRAGLLGRRHELGGGHAILKASDAIQEKLAPELVERVERLNTDELIDATRAAQLEMRRATPDADKGDLDEGLQNTRRSIEFLKAAARRLTLAQIYDAYAKCQHDIFFVDESRKAAGFERAIQFQLGAQGRAVADLKSRYPMQGKDAVDWKAVRAQGEALGWFQGLEDAEFNSFRNLQAGRVLRIVKDGIRRPAVARRSVPKLGKDDARIGGQPVDPAVARRYLELGGDDLFYEVWPDPTNNTIKAKPERRVAILEALAGIETL